MHMSREIVIYDFPDDDGASYEAVLAKLPSLMWADLETRWREDYGLRFSNLTDQIAVVLAVGGLVTVCPNGLLDENEVGVPIDLRAATEAALGQLNIKDALWTERRVVEGSGKGLTAFQAEWEAMWRSCWPVA